MPPAGLFTDLKTYDVGTRGRFDKPTDRFDTPTLVEGWRTAPYLHDGSAATMRDVFAAANPQQSTARPASLPAMYPLIRQPVLMRNGVVE